MQTWITSLEGQCSMHNRLFLVAQQTNISLLWCILILLSPWSPWLMTCIGLHTCTSENAKLFNWDFDPLEAVSRSHDPQFQVSENY